MNLAIYDKGGGRFSDRAATAARNCFDDASVTVLDPMMNPTVDCLLNFSCVICHLNSLEEEEPSWPHLIAMIAGNLTEVKVVIRVSSQGAGGMSDSFKSSYRLKDGPWILHLIERSSDLKVPWADIFKAIKQWDTAEDQIPGDIAAIFDPHPEFSLALRLLCEAWLMRRDEIEVKAIDSKQHKEIIIHPPVTPEQWFGPFGKDVSQESAQEIAANLVSPDVSAQVKAFLLDVAKLKSVPPEGVRRLAMALGIVSKTI